MVTGVLCSAEQKNEFEAIPRYKETEIIWVDSLRSLGIVEADIYFDLLFEPDPERISRLKNINGQVIINSVQETSRELQANFLRIAGWPRLLGRKLMELTAPGELPDAGSLLNKAGFEHYFVPDIVGMVSPRVIAMVINEAYFALGENISSREDIDLAMRSGTNYPFGPFQWAEKIGQRQIASLLTRLSRQEPRYEPAPLLQQEINH